MARPRVYRHQVRCPECGSNRMPKDGQSKGRQVCCPKCGSGRRLPPPLHSRSGLSSPQRRQQGARYGHVPGRQLVARHRPGFRG